MKDPDAVKSSKHSSNLLRAALYAEQYFINQRSLNGKR